MRVALKPHPDTPSRAIEAIEVEVVRLTGGRLELRYEIRGRLGELAMPPHALGRADGLWQHTCVEAFVGGVDEAGYCEFNFSPSTQWAAYAFEGYRDGMRALETLGDPQRSYEFGPDRFVLIARLELAISLPVQKPWRVGLAAVIEETDGAKSYWALKHPPGKPDFHHADGFVLELP
jgi:hypothetical protein